MFIMSFSELSVFYTASLLCYTFSLFSVVGFAVSRASLSRAGTPYAQDNFKAPYKSGGVSPFPEDFSTPFVSDVMQLSAPLMATGTVQLNVFTLVEPMVALARNLYMTVVEYVPTTLTDYTDLRVTSSASFSTAVVESTDSSAVVAVYNVFNNFSMSLPSVTSVVTLWPFVSLAPLFTGFSCLSIVSRATRFGTPTTFLKSMAAKVVE